MTAGYSGTPLVRRLGVKQGRRAASVDAPTTFIAALGALPEGVQLMSPGSRAGSLDVMVAFLTQQRALKRRLAGLGGHLNQAGGLWIAWPKRGSGVASDLGDGIVRDR